MSKVYNFRYDLIDLTDETIGDNAYEYYLDDGMQAPTYCSVFADDFETAKKLAEEYMTTPMLNSIESAAVNLISTITDTLPTVVTTTAQAINGNEIQITMTVQELNPNQVV